MFKIIIYLIWCVVGFCLMLAGCGFELSADSMEVRWGLKRAGESEPTKVEVYYDQDRSGGEDVQPGFDGQ